MTERERRRLVVEHLTSGNAEGAAEELAASRERYPGDGALHRAIGLAFASRGTLSRALEQLEAAAGLEPDSPEIMADLAQVRLAHGQETGAVEAAERALELSPDLAIARFTLGRALFVAECKRQGRRPGPPDPQAHFPLVDGRAPAYLRAVEQMELALDAGPPFAGAVRVALALAYQRAGHYHAAAEQLRNQLEEAPAGKEADGLRQALQDLECEIAREAYWAPDAGELARLQAIASLAPEAALRLLHARIAAGQLKGTPETMKEARDLGYGPCEADVVRTSHGRERCRDFSDVHLLMAGGLECVVAGSFRVLPFSELRAVTFGEVKPWRQARVELATGEELHALVPMLYRFSLRSPSELIQSGRFTQFSYGPGENRWAYAMGARSFTADTGIIPAAEVEAIIFPASQRAAPA